MRALPPPAELESTALERWLRLMLAATLIGANVGGVLIIAVLLALVIPEPAAAARANVRETLMLVGIAYVVPAIAVGYAAGRRSFRVAVRWLLSGSRATVEDRLAVLRGPRRLLAIQGGLWICALPLFGAVSAIYSGVLARNMVLTIALAGATTSTVTYLVSERVLRPVTVLVLAGERPPYVSRYGVALRVLLAWALGTGVPIVGLLLVALAAIVQPSSVTVERLVVPMLALGLVALVIGALVTGLAAGATADPVRSVARALASVERGDLSIEVPVYDATEVGLLQSGFNAMVAGLRERERIRELFGAHVGADVARAALAAGEAELGGQRRDVAVLFVDLIGSTAFAQTHEPEVVVAMLNRLFAVVVRAVDDHGGWINKFEGDGALAVFGAPNTIDDPSGRALGAARRIASELPSAVPECEAAVGVSAGSVVAGHIGERNRYEYTVIGDPVNEAARLTDLAKTRPVHVLAAGQVLDRASVTERAAWEPAGEAVLRGRAGATPLAAPRTS